MLILFFKLLEGWEDDFNAYKVFLFMLFLIALGLVVAVNDPPFLIRRHYLGLVLRRAKRAAKKRGVYDVRNGVSDANREMYVT